MLRLLWIAGLLWSVPALAQEADLPYLIDVKLAINGVGTGLQQLGRAVENFVNAASQTRREADYWRDACQSTPGCGTPK